MEKIIIDVGEGKIVTLHFSAFDSDVDLDNITKIDFENIVAEIVTISALLNKVALLKADVDNRFSLEKLELDIYEAGLKKMFRAKLVSDGKKFTIDEVDGLVLMDEGWQNRKKKLIRYQKDCDYLNSIYWSVKDKSDKLGNIKNNLTPKEFVSEIIEGTVNTIMIKLHKKMSKDV